MQLGRGAPYSTLLYSVVLTTSLQVEYKSIPQKGASLPNSSTLTDPRTATSLWLYEEFIPPEYRAQLTAPKRKIPFPFPRNTPFAGIHVGVNKPMPRIPNARELEFEGLLKGGNGNVTKVISLNGGGGRTVMMTATTTTEKKKEKRAAAPPMVISGPLYVVGKDGPSGVDAHPPSSSAGISSTTTHDERPPTPTTPVDTIASVTTAGPLSPHKTTTEPPSAPSQASSNPPRTPSTPTHPTGQAPPGSKRSRFPLPSPSLRRRHAGQRPAEYDATLEFSTRTMWDDGREAHSDDEEDEYGKGSKAKKRESRDDAWVDILVGSQSRRMDSQAAVLRPATASGALGGAGAVGGVPKNKKRMGVLGSFGEADRVQEEVRQALRDAGPPPPESVAGDDDDDDDGYRYGSFDASGSQYSTDATAAASAGGDGDSPIATVRQAGREVLDEQLRPRTSQSLEDEEQADDDDALYGPPELGGRLGTHHARDDRLLLDEADFEPMPHMRSPSDRSEFAEGSAAAATVPLAVAPKPPAKGKGVSSLIEMYREKEAAATTYGGGSSVSRIPIRAPAASTSTIPPPSPPLPAPPHLVPSNAPVPPPHAHLIIDAESPSQSRPLSTMTDDYPASVGAEDDDASSVVPSELDEQELEEYLKKHVKISSNTPRYVHGAPLHNVVEEEEEP